MPKLNEKKENQVTMETPLQQLILQRLKQAEKTMKSVARPISAPEQPPRGVVPQAWVEWADKEKPR